MAPRQGSNQGDILRSFTLGNKELEGKTVEFQYDKGQYTITDVVGEERNVIYKSRNAQEAYTKWNVYIGRKKERPERPERQLDGISGTDRQGRGKNGSREDGNRGERSGRRQERGESRTDRQGRRRDREEVRMEYASGGEESEEFRADRFGKSRDRKERHGRRQDREHTNRSRRNGSTGESNGGYHQGFTASQGGTEASGDRAGRRPRHRRNNHKGQETQE